MINDEWNRDPAKWHARPLHERLEMLRKYHCTGPCGQSACVQGTIAALDRALREARDMAAFNLERLEMHSAQHADEDQK